MPICPICQKQYSLKVVPLVLQPCGHSVCQLCFDECSDRNIDHCSLCRQLVRAHTVNFSLQEMCQEDELGWKSDLCDLLSPALVGHRFTISDGLKPVAPLLALKAHGEHDIHCFREVFVHMIQEMSPSTIYQWIEVLNFRNKHALNDLVTQLVCDKHFLLRHDALWVLELGAK